MTEAHYEELRNKVDFVADIMPVIAEHFPHIEDLTYEVYQNVKNEEWITEVLVYHFAGGAILVRDCSGNSKLAILEELTNYINGGYYDEVPNYRNKLLNQELYRRLF